MSRFVRSNHIKDLSNSSPVMYRDAKNLEPLREEKSPGLSVARKEATAADIQRGTGASSESIDEIKSHTNGEARFASHRDDLRQYIRRIFPHPEDAEDILQDTYVKVLRRAADLGQKEEPIEDGQDNNAAPRKKSDKQEESEAIKKPRAYLFVTAANLIKDKLKNKQRSIEKHHISADDVDLSCHNSDPEKYAISERLKRDLTASLEKLDPKYRQVFVLHRYKHLTHVEIAEKLNLSVRTVERYMKVALEHMRKQLREYL